MSKGFKDSDLAVINTLRDCVDSFDSPIACCVCCVASEVFSLPCGGFICRGCYEIYGLQGKCPVCDKPGDVYRPTRCGDNHCDCNVKREDIIDPKFICPSCNNEHPYVPPSESDNAGVVSSKVRNLLDLNTDKYTKAAKERGGKSISELSEEHKRLEEELEGAKSQSEAKRRELDSARAREKENNDRMSSLDQRLAECRAEAERIGKELSAKASQNEANRQKLEEKQRELEEFEEEKRRLEEEIAQDEGEKKALEETNERNKREIQELEMDVTESKKRLEELMKRLDDDDDDVNNNNNCLESHAKRRQNPSPLHEPRLTRTLQINVDFAPLPPKGHSINQGEVANGGGAGGMVRGMINFCQNVKDAMPGPTRTGAMRDIAEFDVRERLGVWGSGKPVLRAVLRETGESYALKKVVFRKAPAPVLNASSWTSAKPSDEEKCQHSINALGDDELSHFAEPYILTSIHTGNEGIAEIVRPEYYVRDKNSSGTLFYIAMPYYSMDLEYAITKGIVRKTQLRSVAVQLFRGIAYLHSLGIVHRDISTASILIRKPTSQLSADTCPITIAGMGHATLASRARNAHPEFRLSRFHPPECFTAAELVDNDKFWVKADIWSIGCVLAEIALGRKMFSTEELPEIDSSAVSERANRAADAISGDDDDEDYDDANAGLVDCIRNTLVFNPVGRTNPIKALNGLGEELNVFSNEQPLMLGSGNIRTFISKVCPYVSI